MQTSQGALNDLALGNVTLKLLRRAVCPAAGQKQGPGGLPIHIGSSTFFSGPGGLPTYLGSSTFFSKGPGGLPTYIGPSKFFSKGPRGLPTYIGFSTLWQWGCFEIARRDARLLLDAAKASPGDVQSLEVAIQAAAAAKLEECQMEAEQSLQKLDDVCMLLGMLCGRSPAGEANEQVQTLVESLERAVAEYGQAKPRLGLITIALSRRVSWAA